MLVAGSGAGDGSEVGYGLLSIINYIYYLFMICKIFILLHLCVYLASFIMDNIKSLVTTENTLLCFYLFVCLAILCFRKSGS